jgi:hypothetical protein
MLQPWGSSEQQPASYAAAGGGKQRGDTAQANDGTTAMSECAGTVFAPKARREVLDPSPRLF